MVDRKGAREALGKVLAQVNELEDLVGNFGGDNSQLHAKINEYVASLRALHAAGTGLVSPKGDPYEVPVELLRYLDDGGNPDVFIADVMRSCLAANQSSKGKVEAVRQFKDAVTEQLAVVYPEEVARYKAVRTGAASAPEAPS